ncbi:MAG TPA: hypothetical protein VNK89_00010 [Thermoflexus sp.]|nr:hypothetical protein [Thermoflexus sp.]
MLLKRDGRWGWRLLALGLLVLLGMSGWILSSKDQWDLPLPPTPEWVNPNGQGDPSRFPTRIGIADETGRVVGWVDPREEPFFLMPPPPGTPAPCRFRVRDAQGNLIGYFGSPPDAESWPERAHPPSNAVASRPGCPAPFRFYPLSDSKSK